MARAPATRANWTSRMPRPPPAAVTSTHSPGSIPVPSSRPNAVLPSWSSAAASRRSTPSGTASPRLPACPPAFLTRRFPTQSPTSTMVEVKRTEPSEATRPPSSVRWCSSPTRATGSRPSTAPTTSARSCPTPAEGPDQPQPPEGARPSEPSALCHLEAVLLLYTRNPQDKFSIIEHYSRQRARRQGRSPRGRPRQRRRPAAGRHEGLGRVGGDHPQRLPDRDGVVLRRGQGDDRQGGGADVPGDLPAGRDRVAGQARLMDGGVLPGSGRPGARLGQVDAPVALGVVEQLPGDAEQPVSLAELEQVVEGAVVDVPGLQVVLGGQLGHGL